MEKGRKESICVMRSSEKEAVELVANALQGPAIQWQEDENNGKCDVEKEVHFTNI